VQDENSAESEAQVIDAHHGGALRAHGIHQRNKNRNPGKQEHAGEQLEGWIVPPALPVLEQYIETGDGHHHHRHFHDAPDGKHDEAGPDQE
jgi:hypothetical protein